MSVYSTYSELIAELPLLPAARAIELLQAAFEDGHRPDSLAQISEEDTPFKGGDVDLPALAQTVDVQVAEFLLGLGADPNLELEEGLVVADALSSVATSRCWCVCSPMG